MIQRTPFVSSRVGEPTHSSPHSSNLSRPFLGWGYRSAIRTYHQTVRGLTASPQSRPDLPWWVMSILLTEEGEDERWRALADLPRCAHVPTCTRSCSPSLLSPFPPLSWRPRRSIRFASRRRHTPLDFHTNPDIKSRKNLHPNCTSRTLPHMDPAGIPRSIPPETGVASPGHDSSA